jgi:DNA modification methylase
MSALELKWLDPADVEGNPKNWREHPPAQAHALSSSLDTVGWAGAALFNKRTGRLVDGHLRQKQAQDRGELLPVLVGDWSEAQESYILATLDPIAAAARVNETALDNLLAEINAAVKSGDLTADTGHLDDLLRDLQRTPAPPTSGLLPDADPDAVPETAPARCAAGDLWGLGGEKGHRLLCGDATCAEDVARLLGGAKPLLMVTDPPYGVDYDPDWRNDAADKGLIAHAASRVGLVANDDRIDWREAWLLFSGDVFYCWHADRHASSVQASVEAAGFEIRCQIIWAKSRFAISRGHYNWQHEPCWYAVRKGATANWQGDHSQTTLWEITLDANVEGGHSTQKPAECMLRAIRNHEGDVYDPFLGSGTTLIAAESLGRRCYGLEIEPRYCDVILQRWETLTGRAATLLSRVNEPARA